MIYDVEVVEMRKRMVRVQANNRGEAKRFGLKMIKEDIFKGIVYQLDYKLGKATLVVPT